MTWEWITDCRKTFFCLWIMVTLVKEVVEQFPVGGTALRLSKFDTVDLVLAVFWSRYFSVYDMILVMFVFALKLFNLDCKYSNEVVNRETPSRSQNQSLKRHENEVNSGENNTHFGMFLLVI